MIKNFAKKAGSVVKTGVTGLGEVVSQGVESVGGEKSAQWIREASKGVGTASGASLELAGRVTEGAYKTIKGQYKQDIDTRAEGFEDIKESANTIGKSIVSLVKNTSSSVYETGVGLATKDYDRMRAGLWKGSQIAVVAFAAVGVVDFIDGGDVVLAESINDHHEGTSHPITGVPFERTEIQYAGETISGVYPVFESDFTAQLQTSEYTLSDVAHENIANLQLYEAIQQNPSLQYDLGLTDAEVNSLQSNVTPEGYTWHHHEQPGQIQLVESSVHDQTGHTGGRHIWGGSTEAR